MYAVHTPQWVRALVPGVTFARSAPGAPIYLTFDDGPTPGVTDPVLDLLARYQAKATFFCLGRQASKHPELLLRIMAEGHTVGNHTYTHLDGWRSAPKAYLAELAATDRLISEVTGCAPRLFRPPYGRLNPLTLPTLRRSHEVVLWDVLPGDFDPRVSAGACAARVIRHAQPGSIVVLHDNARAGDKMIAVLAAVLTYFGEQGAGLGGITEANEAEVRAAGAYGTAAIGWYR